MAPGRRRCDCTLPFSLHLTVLILGILGIILTVVATALVLGHSSIYKTTGSHGAAVGSVIWLLLTTVLVAVSGLQGLLWRDTRKWHLFFVVLAVLLLVDLGVLIVAFILIGSPFWIIYMTVLFVLELRVLRLRKCCKPRGVGTVAMNELPVANPAAPYSVANPEAPYSVANPAAPYSVANPAAPYSVANPAAPYSVEMAQPAYSSAYQTNGYKG